MTRRLAQFGLPLLGKELIEQAARKRTYVVRVLYASLLFFAAYLFFYDTLRMGKASPLAVLGRGRSLFDALVGLQFAGIYLFMPAITCGVLAHEKERASLQLLFLTRLGPWTILFEKLLSRLVPMFCFLLLSLPLLAFAYTLGGISPEYLASGVWMLLVSVFQIGTLALMCSAYCRTTAGAFVASYLIGLAMFFMPALVWGALSIWGFERLLWSSLQEAAATFGPAVFSLRHVLEHPFFGFVLFFSGNAGGALPGMAGKSLALQMVLSFPILSSGIVFLLMSRLFLVRRAFAPPRNLLLGFFRRLDRLFTRLNNNRWTKGIELIRDAGSLPADEPVAWRETTKRSLGRARYLIRILVALEFPVAFLCILMAMFSPGADNVAGAFLVFALWGIGLMLVSVQGASLIAGERSHQTLDVLCATPLASQEIIRQKFRGMQRLMAVLLVPFFTVFFFQGWWQSQFAGTNWFGESRRSLALYLTCSVLSVGIYLPLAAWLSLWIGLKVRSQARAIIASLVTIVVWCVGPVFFVIMPLAILTSINPSRGSPFLFVLLSTPAAAVVLNEYHELREIADAPWVAVILNFMLYGAALVFIRHRALSRAALLLGRSESA